MEEKKLLFKRLDNVNDHDRILLKKSVGRSLKKADAQTMAAFYGNVYCSASKEEAAFYLACLYCLQGENGELELPSAWAKFAKKHEYNNNAITRLIDRPWDDVVAQSLVHLIRRMLNEGYKIDFEALMFSINIWNTPKMKRHWARLIATVTEQQLEN